jgi:phosphoadenosine phosphosulfate reductase
MKKHNLNKHISRSLGLINDHFSKGHTISTTSCGLTSSVLIDMVSRSQLDIPIVFIDTNFHFPETIDYFQTLKKRYKQLQFIHLKQEASVQSFETKFGCDQSKSNPDFCCNHNKVKPLREFIKRNNITRWLSAVRKSQNDFRMGFSHLDRIGEKLIKLHPLLLWLEEEVDSYIKLNSLPLHPLWNKGYGSIGCLPCTQTGISRKGRWVDQNKTECGLHLNMKNKL